MAIDRLDGAGYVMGMLQALLRVPLDPHREEIRTVANEQSDESRSSMPDAHSACRATEASGPSASDQAYPTCEPPSHHPTWDQLQSAWDPRVQKQLDIDWIDELPPQLQSDIDGQFRAAAPGQPPTAMPVLKQSVVRPPTRDVLPREGKMLARVNFMAWATHIFGSPAAAKAHFNGIQPVAGRPGMWLAEGARVAFEHAVAAFEAKYPGYTIVDTKVAAALRGRHQTRTGLGMLGHALGHSFDLKAYENFNLRLDDTHSYRYLIAKFGGANGERGRAVMTIEESEVERVGNETRAGISHSPATYAVVDDVRQQFNEMAATSNRLKASMAEQLPLLQAARTLYFETHEAETRDDVTRSLKHAFRNWIDAINADIAADEQKLAQSSPEARAAIETEIAELTFYRDKLLDPKFVFGTVTGDYAGPWGSYRFAEVPLMQLLENGFIRNNAMPSRPGDGDRIEVFNAEVVAVLAEHGFSPGATFGDTMHFDYIAGYNESVLGGRSPENMDHGRFSPEGRLPHSHEETAQ